MEGVSRCGVLDSPVRVAESLELCRRSVIAPGGEWRQSLGLTPDSGAPTAKQGFGYTALGTAPLIPRSAQVNSGPHPSLLSSFWTSLCRLRSLTKLCPIWEPTTANAMTLHTRCWRIARMGASCSACPAARMGCIGGATLHFALCPASRFACSTPQRGRPRLQEAPLP